MSLREELAAVVGPDHVLVGEALRPYLQDATEAQSLGGRADAYARPRTAAEVGELVRLCGARSVPITVRGGGSGWAGGCVPDGGLVLGLERLTAVRSFDPLRWQATVEAGVTTRHVQRLARENGLYYPVDPGAPEQSQIGGNVATNAGGPHAFKYGVTGAWVTGLEVVLASGAVVRLGQGLRKDVAGYDLKSLMIGSEGTLGIVTAVDLRFIPAVEARYPVVGWYPSVEAGCAAIEAAMASGTIPAAIEYLDGPTMEIAGAGFPAPVPDGVEMALIVEADGDAESAASGRELLCDALAEGAIGVHRPEGRDAIEALWRWREGVGLVVTAHLGGKLSEDIAAPLDRLAEAILGTLEIGRRYDLQACSWGHAGDGNLHSTFMVRPGDADELRRAHEATDELFAMAVELGGSISGEHGVGLVKGGQLRRQWDPPAVGLHEAVKRVFDPDNILNPGKKVA